MAVTIQTDSIERKVVKHGNGAHIIVPKEWLDKKCNVLAFCTKTLPHSFVVDMENTLIQDGVKHYQVTIKTRNGFEVLWMTEEAIRQLKG